MRVTPFELHAGAHLFGSTVVDVASRDGQSTEVPRRWLAWEGDEAVGAVMAARRPDAKLFLSFRGARVSREVLIEACLGDLAAPFYVNVAEEDAEMLAVCLRHGLKSEVISEAFNVSFDMALARLRWPERSRLEVISAAEADHDRLFVLDNSLRQDVPGTDGWTGNRMSFEAELSETPPFDPATYLVAISPDDGQYMGLVRIWRNPTGPALGLVGVLPEYRATAAAAVLLQTSLRAASTWGFPAFTAHTSVTNRWIHPRLLALGARSRGRFHQMVRAWVATREPGPGTRRRPSCPVVR